MRLCEWTLEVRLDTELRASMECCLFIMCLMLIDARGVAGVVGSCIHCDTSLALVEGRETSSCFWGWNVYSFTYRASLRNGICCVGLTAADSVMSVGTSFPKKTLWPMTNPNQSGSLNRWTHCTLISPTAKTWPSWKESNRADHPASCTPYALANIRCTPAIALPVQIRGIWPCLSRNCVRRYHADVGCSCTECVSSMRTTWY